LTTSRVFIFFPSGLIAQGRKNKKGTVPLTAQATSFRGDLTSP
jgi:hypothetical protein